MEIDFTNFLSKEERKELVIDRLKKFAAEAYQHELNKKAAIESNREELIQASNEALRILGDAIKIHQLELEELDS